MNIGCGVNTLIGSGCCLVSLMFVCGFLVLCFVNCFVCGCLS